MQQGDRPTPSIAGALTRRYVVALAAIALLLIAGQALVQRALTSQANDARIVNIAGRQRMLGQRLTMLTLAIERSRGSSANGADRAARLEELFRVADEWQRSQRMLRDEANLNDTETLRIYDAIAPSQATMLVAARTLASSDDAVSTAAERRSLVDTMLAAETPFLNGMDAIVFRYDDTARARVARLGRTEASLLALTLLVLAFEGLFVFRTAVANLRLYLAQRTRAEAARAESEARKDALIRAIPDVIVSFSRVGDVLGVEGASAPSVDRVLPPGVAVSLAAVAREVAHEKKSAMLEYAGIVSGEARHAEARVVPCTPDGALALIRDITERKRLQREVLEVSDREQRRLGQDLHDGVGQLLVGVALMLKRHEQTTAAVADRANLAEIGRHLQRAIAQTRSVAKGLYAVDLDLESLGAALEELASNAEAIFRVRCAAHVAARPVSRAPKHATAHLIRVAREAVANAAKHAQPSRIDITLAEEPDAIVLRVRDDGCGFDVDEAASKSNAGGMGIHLMRYRASLMEATLNLESRRNEGTTVTCRVPVDVATRRGSAVSA